MNSTLGIACDPQFIRPLKESENEFVQALVTTFTISPWKDGFCLDTEFGSKSPSIWLRAAKRYIAGQLDSAKVAKYQQELESVISGRHPLPYTFSDPLLPFRFGNGGTLPVIRIGGKDYYAFFYRETPPVGWNIANGGADSVAELCDPQATIERELREELILVEPTLGAKYVFDWENSRSLEHQDFRIARNAWSEIFQERGVSIENDLILPLKWLHGPDAIRIAYDEERAQGDLEPSVSDCFVNINAEDFGIEIDRIAKMSIGPKAILCDGEVVSGQLLNRVVGLFEVNRFNARMAAGDNEYYPDRLFHNGREFDLPKPESALRDILQSIVAAYVQGIIARGLRDDWVEKEWTQEPAKFGLCPVTRNLLRRFLRLESDGKWITADDSKQSKHRTKSQIDVFLSFPSEDLSLARQVCEFLKATGRKVFFHEESIRAANFGKAIDEALDEARALVVIGTRSDYFYKPWVQYEWRSFHNDILGSRKDENAPLITMAQDSERKALPRPLLFREIITFEPGTLEPALRRLNEVLF